MTITALIPAAGAGRRMEATVNKQYLELAGRPVLAHTLAVFEQHPAIDRIVIVTPAEEIAYCRAEIVDRGGFRKVAAIVAGGAERQDSVRNGLAACAGADDDLVLIHDGARPLLTPALIDGVIAAARETGACLAAVPVKDTVKRVENGRVTGTPERSSLWLAQTPQGFRLGLIVAAHRRAEREGFRGTDDAQLVERQGHPVAVVPGSYRNLKITTPDDLPVAAALLAAPGEGLK